ncbi:RsiW-degrading membrane proteinase PrsW (M82 family) [Knoellia remsis]|uniref:RsiW-degrading membrane proteinase PrsW (M82 family) n=1 Tax=Knoellia remsis TaxID=407159 RepID=A0A2T0UTU5_9MICO|nr:PrsW family intramembrane metalloprotease [Knoellia remsis]PRY61352.1 RsiW-degrading membrane proteinase PrsW (M82 family) [Knoellia remsis]
MSGDLSVDVQTPVPPTPQRSAGAHRGRPMLRRWILTGIAVVGFGLAALAVAVAIGAAAGVSATLLGFVIAMIPLGIVVPTFLWLDRFEAEPTRNLVLAFLWGALIAVLIAMTLNTAGQLVLWGSVPADESLALTAVFVAPFVEEAAKGAFVLLVWLFAKREFDGITDGMVYAGVTAAGFAFTENIQYLALAWVEYGQEGLTATFIGRGIMSPFAHPMFTICIGVGVGVAAMTRRWLVRIVAIGAGYVIAVLAHALWNLAAVSGAQGLIAVYLLVEVPIFLAFLGFVVWVRRREGRLIGQFLSPYADAGWLSPAEVVMLASMPRRREARQWARVNGGRAALRSMEDFQDAASELALLRRRMQHIPPDERTLRDERDLLAVLTRRRREFAGQLI